MTFVASPTPTAALSFSPARYYPVDNSPIYIRGYYPAGTLSGKTVTLAGDGTEDVMLTAQASGTKATAGALSCVFNHLRPQLQFKLVAGAGYPASGVNVTSLVIKQQKTPATLDLNTSSLTYTTKDLTLSGTFPIQTAGSTINNFNHPYLYAEGNHVLYQCDSLADRRDRIVHITINVLITRRLCRRWRQLYPRNLSHQERKGR